MKLIAIESSALVASVAYMEDDKLVAEYTVDHKKTHSQTLLPMLSEIREMVGIDLAGIDAVAVAGGPGSFTGLRIGSATAKGLGLALDVPLISVPTVDAIAYNLCGAEGLVCPMMDARREQVYTGIYHFMREEKDTGAQAIRLVADMEQCPMDVGALCERLNEMGQQVTLLGDGVPVYLSRIEEALKVPYLIAPAHLSRQRAGALAALAMQYASEGRLETAAEHRPDYLRLSQAEREAAEKAAAEGKSK